MNPRSTWLTAILCGLIFMSSAPVFADDAPADPLAPYQPLVVQVRQYRELLSGVKWERVYDDQFDPKEEPKFVASTPKVTVTQNNVTKEVPTTHFDKVDGKNVLVFETTNLPPDGMENVLAIGPKVSGDFAIEFEGELINDNPSDLAIFASIHDGPGFQFGGHQNTENIITTVSPDAVNLRAAKQHTAVPSPIGNTPLIEKNRFYRVRLEVMDHEVRGFVDGKLIGSQPLDPKGWDGKLEVQPQIYTWDSVMRIRSAHVDKRVKGDKAVDTAEAWTKAFGEMTKENFNKKMDALAELMGDDDSVVRDGAQAMLTRFGDLAIPALKSAVTDGTPEESQRARAALKSLGVEEP